MHQESVWVIYQSFYPVTLSYKQCIMATSQHISRVLAAIYIFTNTSALHANTDTNIITPHHSARDGTIIQDANNVTRRVNAVRRRVTCANVRADGLLLRAGVRCAGDISSSQIKPSSGTNMEPILIPSSYSCTPPLLVTNADHLAWR